MNRAWQQLHPLSHSAFLHCNGAGDGRDLLLDMGHHGASLDAALQECGSSTVRIAHLLITHNDADHLMLDEAAAMAVAGTEIHLGAASWDHIGDVPAKVALGASGHLNLLPPHGEMTLADRTVVWATFPHGVNKPNIAYRIDDQLFSGDTPVTALLDPANSAAAALLGLDGGSTRGLWINTAQRSRADIHAIADLLGPARRDKFLANHGIAEDLISAVGKPQLRQFFAGLARVVPHHLRRAPLPETAVWIRERLNAAREVHGFSFRVDFPGSGLS
jgi:hypothetical protein